MRQLADDTIIDGRYRVTAHLGSGGMAEVYCATDLQLGRSVALKILHERFAADEEFVERFKREASSAAGLAHQHVVAVYDRGEWKGTSYIAMEYVPGQTLKQIITQTDPPTPLPPQRAVDLTVQILRAARFAHRRGIVHRDFKPQNVIVDEEDRAKVTDFGIARAGASDMTETGSILGTAQYLSPEQAQGHAVGARSDLYSIGIVLYELLTGRVPFDGDSAVTIALKQVSELPVPPSEINPQVTPELESVVLRALEKDPADRFADADEFIAALDAAASRIPSPRAIAAAEAAAAAAAAGGAVLAPPTGSQTMVVPPGGVAQRPPRRAARQGAGGAPPAPPPAPEPGPQRKRWPWLVLAGLLLVGVVLALVPILSPKQVKVPPVVGSTILVAQQRLQAAGFEVQSVRDNSVKPRNTVIQQDPAGGAQRKKGSQVTITVSDGPAIKNVPDVVGDPHLVAHKTLTDAGFTVGETRVSSDTVPVNKVISQSPDGRSLGVTGQKVVLQVSTGPERLPVPNVVGKTEDAARSALSAFRIVIKPTEDSKHDPGTVLKQTPARPNLPAQATITLAVATQPKKVPVPDVVGRSQNYATKVLSGAGFEVTPQEVAVDSADQDGKVQQQDPGAGGGKVDRGSTVTISVGHFDPTLNFEPGTPTTTAPATTTPTPTTTTPSPGE
jgi:serine/threonine-protein kinase